MTNEPLPAPLLPADVDLNGYQFMPLYGHRLFGSEFNARCSDAAWRAGVTLWWAAWNQVPAASLPDDDAALCRLADLGRDVKAWRKIRADALHGFVKCSDGRLYHRALAEYAAEAWDRRVRDRARKAAWRAGRNADGERDGTRTETGTRTGQGRDVPADRDRDRDTLVPKLTLRPGLAPRLLWTSPQARKSAASCGRLPVPGWLPTA